jgi:hypothetical protein
MLFLVILKAPWLLTVMALDSSSRRLAPFCSIPPFAAASRVSSTPPSRSLGRKSSLQSYHFIPDSQIPDSLNPEGVWQELIHLPRRKESRRKEKRPSFLSHPDT